MALTKSRRRRSRAIIIIIVRFRHELMIWVAPPSPCRPWQLPRWRSYFDELDVVVVEGLEGVDINDFSSIRMR